MSIATQNLLRMIGSGYGSSGETDPYSVYAALLGESSGDLAAKKYNEQLAEQKRQYNESLAMQQKNLDEMIKEANLRGTMQLATSGFGTEGELNKLGQTYGLTYQPKKTTPETGLASTTGDTADLSKLLQTYNSLQPYVGQIVGGSINPLYDAGKTNLYYNLQKKLSAYGA